MLEILIDILEILLKFASVTKHHRYFTKVAVNIQKLRVGIKKVTGMETGSTSRMSTESVIILRLLAERAARFAGEEPFDDAEWIEKLRLAVFECDTESDTRSRSVYHTSRISHESLIILRFLASRAVRFASEEKWGDLEWLEKLRKAELDSQLEHDYRCALLEEKSEAIASFIY